MAFTESNAISPIDPRSTSDISTIHSPATPVTPTATYSLLSTKFDRSMEVTDEYLVKLSGVDGNSGYLGTLNSLITAYALPSDLPTLTIDIDTTTPTADQSPPTADLDGVDTSFPPFTATAPVPIALPTIDTSSLALITPPDSSITTTINWSEIPLTSDVYDVLVDRITNAAASGVVSWTEVPLVNDVYTFLIDRITNDITSGEVNWSEILLSTDLYDQLITRVTTDLVAGATGLDPVVEQGIFDRALARQALEDDKAQQEIEEYYSATDFDLPTGAFAARLAEHLNERQRKTADTNIGIMEKQADLAQKNSQFIITQVALIEKMLRDTRDSESGRLLDKEKLKAELTNRNAQFITTQAVAIEKLIRDSRDSASGRSLDKGKIEAELIQRNEQFITTQLAGLEKMLRDSRDAESNRKLDKEKSQVQYLLQLFAEKVRAYLGEMEATKIYIEAQVSALQGAVEYNKGLVQVYGAQADVYETLVGAQAKANDAIVNVYDAEIRGYEAETKALNADKMVVVENNKALIAKAEVEMRAIIAKIENSIEGYKTEALLRERVSNDMATIAAQVVASMASSTNVNASMGYTGSESRSEGFDHNESITQGVHFSQNVSEDHNFQHNPVD